MESILIVILLIGVIVLLALFYIQSRSLPSSAGLIQQQMDSIRREMSDQLSRSQTHLNEELTRQSLPFTQQMGQLAENVQLASGQMGLRFDHASHLVGEVQQNLRALSLATEKVYEVGKDISSLQEILKAPKLRGSFGEFLLGELLSQILPSSSFTLQYMFKSGEIVDALIHLGQGGIPVDSKFPLDNFKKMMESSLGEEEKKAHRRKFIQDMKRHVDQISSKYILPDEGTFDFAFMYIPAENVYYEIIIKDEEMGDEKPLSAYSLAKKVIPVSPNSFYAYLQSILLGLKGFHMEKSARETLDYISRLRVDFLKFKEDFEILGKHLNNARLKYEESVRKSDRFHDKLNEFEIPLQKEPDQVAEINRRGSGNPLQS